MHHAAASVMTLPGDAPGEPIDAPGPARTGWWQFIATTLYAALCAVTAGIATVHGHPEAWLAMLAVPVAIFARDRPWLFAAALIVGGTWLRIVFAGFGPMTDQIAVSQAAAAHAGAGGNPYGHGYAESVPPGAPFPYGPLTLLWAPLGVWGEIIAATATMALIAWARCPLTLAVYAALWWSVDYGTVGINDVTPGLFITAGALALRTRPRWSAVWMAIAAGFKPYAFAWFPGIIGVGGVAALAVEGVATLVIWAPALLLWGPAAILHSIELARNVHPIAENALDRPELRLVAAPIALGALFVRRWWLAVASGIAIFLVVLFFDRWASLGYLLAIGPIVGILLEHGLASAARAARS